MKNIQIKSRRALKLTDFESTIDSHNITKSELKIINKKAKASNILDPVVFINGSLLFSNIAQSPILVSV